MLFLFLSVNGKKLRKINKEYVTKVEIRINRGWGGGGGGPIRKKLIQPYVMSVSWPLLLMNWVAIWQVAILFSFPVIHLLLFS